MTLYKWSQTANSNANSDSTINWAEGMPPSAVNDSSRAEMAAVAKYRDDNSGILNTAGSSTAITITSNQVTTVLLDGFSITARITTTNGAAPTLNVDATGAKAIRTYTSVAVPTGALLGGAAHKFTYDSADDCWYVHGFFFIPEFASGTKLVFWQTSAPTGWTKDVANDNKALRIVSGAAGTGGSVAFTTAFASKSVAGTVGDTVLDITQIPAHTHTYDQPALSSSPTGSGATRIETTNSGVATGSAGGGLSHTHTFTGTAINLAVSYVDVILATKN